MTGVDALKNEIKSQSALVERLVVKINSLNDELKEVDRNREIQKSKLDGLIFALNMISPNSNEQSGNKSIAKQQTEIKRRMRLVSKKRIIFSLIKAGYKNQADILSYLANSNIESRHIRDVIRESKVDGNISEDQNKDVFLTDKGNELLEKAPEPSDWSVYKTLLREGEPQGSPKQNTLILDNQSV